MVCPHLNIAVVHISLVKAFLRKIGKVGGAANKDFANAMGVDEGPAGKAESSRRKVRDESAKLISHLW